MATTGITISFSKAPLANGDSYSFDESIDGSILTLDVMSNDLGGVAKKLFSLDDGLVNGSTSAGELLTARTVSTSFLGADIRIQDGKVLYDTTALGDLDYLAQGQHLTDHFVYAIQLSNGTISWATAYVDIVGVNDAPVGVADSGTAGEDTPLVVAAASGVLANDTDVDDGATRTVTAVNGIAGDVGHEVTLASGATLTLNADGSYTYNPNGQFEYLAQGQSATDSFSYTVTDDHGASGTATVTITIDGANDAPVVSAIVTASAHEDDAAFNVNLLTNASDVDDGAVLHVANVGVLPAGVTLVGDALHVDPTNAAFQHLAQGVDQVITVGYDVKDAQGGAVAQTAQITITGTNDAPVAQAQTGSTDEDTTFNGTLVATDVDDEVAPLSYSIVSPVAGVTVNPDGTFSVAPLAADQGLDSGEHRDVTFQYVANDGTVDSAPATVTITINGADDGLPLFTVNADNINFNNVLAGSYAAGTQYDALAGDDIVILPSDASKAAQAGYDAANTFFGNTGNDGITGGGLNDKIDGGAGNDTLVGGAGDDSLTGGAGNDLLNGGENPAGQFSDIDTANYLVAGVTTGVNVNLALHTASDGQGGTDTLQNIERVVGTQYGDMLIGGDPANAGNNDSETFEGRGGNDTIIGAVANNRAEYRDAAGAVWVDLRDGKAWDDGDGGVDTLVNINRVRGSAFDDRIYGTDSASTERFEGMAGNDQINGRGGPDAVDYTSSPGAVTVDLALGTASDGFGTIDTLVSIEGVRASDFNDFLYGSNNASGTTEFFEGMAGNDFIDGGDGFDRIEYNRSPSGVTVDLGAGTASDGFGGTDHFVNIEAARGSLFNDTLIGSAGNDTLDGNDGDDILSGGGGNDVLTGGAGNDTLSGGFGNDNLQGGNGDDTFNYMLGTGLDSISGGDGFDTLAIMGTSGNDTINFNLSGPPVSPFGLAPFSGIEAVTVDLDGGSDTLSYAGTTTPVSATVGGAVTGFPGLILGLENLTGGSGNDFLVGDSMDNVLTGGLGNDVLTGGPGNDTFNYTIGDGADTIESVDLQAGGIDTLAITGTGGNDTLDVVWLGSNVGLGTIQQFAGGGTANVDVITLDLGGGNDTLSYAGTFPDIVVQLGVIASGFGGGAILGVENVTAGSGNDILIGDENANVLIGGLGNDTLNGGAGGDTFFYTMGDGADSVDGGAGTDQLMISGTGGNDTLNLIWSGTEISQVAGGAVTGIESAWLDLGAGTDTVSYAGSTADVSAFLGVNASGFPFTFAGVENITGGSGNDNLIGDNNANVLIGGLGNDGLIGGGGNDLLQGGDGNDSLGGWGGNDTLIGGAGNDYMVGDLSGETGNDTFLYVIGDGADSIDGGLGTDTLAITGTGSPNETLAVVWSGSGMISQLAGGTVSNVEIVTLDFTGGEPGDTLSYAGSTQGISVNLQAGSATGFTSIAGVENVTGGSGNDSLTGDNNANVLIGGDGNDILVGGFGSDMLTGSAGADTFVFNSTADSSAALALSDVITDFVHGTDKIDLSAIDAVAGGADDAFVFAGDNSNTIANSVTWSESEGNTIIHINNTGNTGPDMQIILTGIGLGLTSTDFNL